MANVSWIDNLKFRASFGTSGNDQIGLYDYIVTYDYYGYNGLGGYNLGKPYNPNLTWEQKVNTTIGVDFELFHSRLSGGLEWYNAGSNNLLYDVPVTLLSGFTTITQNYAALRNNGIELNLSYGLIQNDNWNWDLAVNYTTLNTVITRLPTKESIHGSKIWKEGGSIYDFYLREWAGVDITNGKPLWNTYDENGVSTGTTSVYNDATRVNSGSSQPLGYGGINSILSYKNWSLIVNTYLSVGGKFLDEVEQDLLSDGASQGYQTITEQLTAWKNPGDVTNVPEFVPSNGSLSNKQSTRYLHDATYFKIKGVVLSFNFNKGVLKSLKLSKLGIYLSGNNLFTLTTSDFHGYDPDFGTPKGVSGYLTPNPTTVVLGIKIGL